MESPTDIIVTAGRTVEIRCSAYGAPRPIITWIKNNVHITEANRYSVSKSGTLSIRDVGKTDEGRYECAARNSIGAASAQMTLTVQSKIYLDFHPHFLVHLLFLGILQWQNSIFPVQSSWQDIIWLDNVGQFCHFYFLFSIFPPGKHQAQWPSVFVKVQWKWNKNKKNLLRFKRSDSPERDGIAPSWIVQFTVNETLILPECFLLLLKTQI